MPVAFVAASALLEIPPTCERSNSVTCAAVYDWTGNETLAHAAAWAIGRPLSILGLVILAIVLRWVAHRIIDRVVRRAESGVLPARFESGLPHSGRRIQRAKAIGSLLHSLTTGIIFGVVFVMILAQIGVNIAPILASAGVLGLAIGFGAQSLVKDFLSGIAMTLEDQYGVGDSVDLGDVSGTVEAIGLRVTRLRDVNGTVWYVRNGEILRVGNQSQNWARSVIDVSVGYSADLSAVRTALSEEAHLLYEDPAFHDKILEEPEVWGVQSMTPEGIVMRVTLKTAPSQQWGVSRAMRERIKDRLDRDGIPVPMAQRLWPRNAPGEGPAGS